MSLNFDDTSLTHIERSNNSFSSQDSFLKRTVSSENLSKRVFAKIQKENFMSAVWSCFRQQNCSRHKIVPLFNNEVSQVKWIFVFRNMGKMYFHAVQVWIVCTETLKPYILWTTMITFQTRKILNWRHCVCIGLESENALVLYPTLPLYLIARARACACARVCVCYHQMYTKRTLGDKSNKWQRFSMFFVL